MKPQPLALFTTARRVLAAGVVACGCLWPAHSNAQPKKAVEPASLAATQFARAMWVWDAGVLVEAERRSTLLVFCARHDITLLYLSVGRVFGEAASKTKPPVSPALLGAFLRRAHAQNIQVHGLDGDPSFALEAKHALTLARLQRALDYNNLAPPMERLDGWQWDIEPYLLPDFKTPEGKRTILSQFLDSSRQMCDAIQKQGDTVPFALGYAIPFWLDSTENSLQWNGAIKPATLHLMDILNGIPDSYIAIMAYRDSTQGPNGSIALSSDEAHYAAQNAPRVRVWIGQETLDVKGDPPSITFWQEDVGELEKAIAQIRQHFKESPAVAGVAIHHWESYRQLTER